MKTALKASHPKQTKLSRNKLPHELKVVPLSNLTPAKGNARTHSKRQVEQITQSIRQFGMISPIIIDAKSEIIAGHARVLAAKQAGLDRVPVLRVEHLTPAEVRAYRLADNKLAENAGWDRKLLSVELQDLKLALPEIGLSVALTGFGTAEVDQIFTDLLPVTLAAPAPRLPEKPTCRLGDLFVLGNHRLYVGDARLEDSYTALLDGKKADMAFLDPPYNVAIQGHAGGRGAIKQREFVCASGEMSEQQYRKFLIDSLTETAAHMRDGAITYVCMDWRHLRAALDAGEQAYDELKNICVWRKTNQGQGSFYRNQHELVLVYKTGTATHVNTFELGQHGRTRTNVWTYPGANGFRKDREKDLKLHPTVKPLALIADTIKDCSNHGDIILDSFCGAGTTMLAAEQLGRRAFCIELDPLYADATILRWQQMTKRDAVLAATEQTYEELVKTRENQDRVDRHG